MKPLIPLLFLLLAACKEDAVVPMPVDLTEESTGYFCQMDLLGHPGPKAQIHLATYPGKPLFFSQVRDAVTYLRMPEQIDTVTATYVSDMGQAASWADPGVSNWVAADAAVYVVGSDARGGMDAPEVVPFGDPAKAQEFATAHGGTVLTLEQIPADALSDPPTADDGDSDFADRLNALSKPGG